tara:strand:+ start:240 stop:758 length:519 start_codon:yes stop_codon:yes gene_type:complete
MNTKTYAFTPASDLAKIIEAAIITKADGIAILQARKERKLAKAKPFGGKSATLLAKLLGLTPEPRPHAQAEEIVAAVEASAGEQEIYAAKCKTFSKKQIAHKLRVVHLPWKKELLLAQEAENAVSDAVDADLNIVAVNDTDAAFALINAIRLLKPEMTEAQLGDAVRALMDA